MGKGRIIASELALKGVSPERIDALANSPSVSLQKMGFGSLEGHILIRNAVTWKRKPENLPEGVKKGLGKAIGVSKACAGTKGMATHPKKGYRIPAKGVCQIEKAPGKAARKYKRRPWSKPYTELGITLT
ncbi:hypothetical protein COX08_03150 [Candidatus Beckwithbacteria bacterium CG23_combo_of_CG06-09_8_20_14_all_34_8]|uniref:Uncharacterized protein n=1 Tax=Candidatus Beckwithbacteria bacterium CG23_combo_of_CG06-09_8_20_14_all_34_8 TaxID=1974497 RepID=A0A2H0B5W4_9BACT|nr:MAG: hypothetical protein COX08_03150 [Candidatus Beckwithbacteria bacterium CG23_combo_of_CG06-09_8_20_14_all_34_8]